MKKRRGQEDESKREEPKEAIPSPSVPPAAPPQPEPPKFLTPERHAKNLLSALRRAKWDGLGGNEVRALAKAIDELEAWAEGQWPGKPPLSIKQIGGPS